MLIEPDILDAVAAAVNLPGAALEKLRREWGGQAVYVRSVRRDIQQQIRRAPGSNREIAARFKMHPNSVARLRRS